MNKTFINTGFLLLLLFLISAVSASDKTPAKSSDSIWSGDLPVMILINFIILIFYLCFLGLPSALKWA